MIKFKQFKPPGIYLTDISKYTGYSDVVGACKRAGVTLYKLTPGRYNPISAQDAYRVIKVIRTFQGRRFLKSCNHDRSA